jgi:predicted alternative tryptophan synthase beta-subunit
MACKFFDLDLEVYMVKVSYQQKPYRRFLMETFGAQVFASPTDRTNAGRSILAEDPNSPGSLGIAISEAVEVAATSGGAKKYSLGSVLNHVLLHQTVIGEESLKQMDMANEYPDVVIGCVGGGSNFRGIALPFLRENLKNGQRTRLVAVEPKATPSLTKGIYAFDYGDTAQMAPIVKMHTLGHSFIPPSIHAGGLRYHGMAPSLCALYDAGLIEAVAVHQMETFEAAVLFAQHEGILPAPESAHAIRVAIDEALDAKEKGEKRVILFNLSGHGNFDLSAYERKVLCCRSALVRHQADIGGPYRLAAERPNHAKKNQSIAHTFQRQGFRRGFPTRHRAFGLRGNKRPDLANRAPGPYPNASCRRGLPQIAHPDQPGFCLSGTFCPAKALQQPCSRPHLPVDPPDRSTANPGCR